MDVRAAARAAAGSAATFASAAPAAAGAGAGDDGGEDDDGDGTVSDKSNADSSEEEAEAPGDATPGGSGSGAGDGGRPKTAASSGTRKGRVPQSKRYEPPMPPWTTQVNACHARDGCKWTIDTMLQTMAEQVREGGWSLTFYISAPPPHSPPPFHTGHRHGGSLGQDQRRHHQDAPGSAPVPGAQVPQRAAAAAQGRAAGRSGCRHAARGGTAALAVFQTSAARHTEQGRRGIREGCGGRAGIPRGQARAL